MLTFIKGLLIGGLVVSNVYSLAIIKTITEHQNSSKKSIYRKLSRDPWDSNTPYRSYK